MKKLLVLLPLVSAITPLATNLHTQNPTHKITVDVGQDVNSWKQNSKATTVPELLNHFSVLKTKYGWDVKQVKMTSFHFSVNDNGTFWGAIAELQNSLKVSVNIFIKYDDNKSYSVNQWQVQKLPSRSNGQLIWQRGFNAWRTSKGTDTIAIGALPLEVAKYWEATSQVYRYRSNGSNSWNHYLIHRLNLRFSFPSYVYTTINHVWEQPNLIHGRFFINSWGSLPNRYYYIDWTASYTAGTPFSYKQLKPVTGDWIHT